MAHRDHQSESHEEGVVRPTCRAGEEGRIDRNRAGEGAGPILEEGGHSVRSRAAVGPIQEAGDPTRHRGVAREEEGDHGRLVGGRRGTLLAWVSAGV